MAVRLSKAFGSTARHWMQLQMNYDLWQVEHRAEEVEVERFVPAYGSTSHRVVSHRCA